MALGLSQYGAKVVIASRNLDRLSEVAREIQSKTGGEAMALQVDVTDENSMTSLVA